jgi:elongation factor Tu
LGTKILELMEADAWIEEPIETLKAFLDACWRCILNYWSWNCATGRIETGVANTGDPVEIIGMGLKN